MAAPTCIQNYILVELLKAFQDEIISDGGIKFYHDVTFRPEWNVTVSGIVASVPLRLTIGDGQYHSLDPERESIIQKVQPGDEIIFSYLVVMNRKQTDNVGEIFTKDNPLDPFTSVWSNPNGLKIIRVYLKNDKYECGLFDTVSKTWVDKTNGGVKDVESFMGKYMATENIGFNYKNLLPYGGKDYWKVDYSNVIAIKKNGIFDMVGEYVILEPIREPRRGDYQGVIEIYNLEQDTDYRAIGKVVSIGETILSVKKGDTICTDIRYVEKYEIDGHDYWIVRQRYIYGKSFANEHKRDS